MACTSISISLVRTHVRLDVPSIPHMRISEAAELLGVPEDTVRRMVDSGCLDTKGQRRNVSSPPARPNESRSPEPWTPTPLYCCSTNRCQRSTRTPARRPAPNLGIRLRAFAGIIILVSHDPLHAVARRSSGVHRGWSSVQEGTPKEVIAKPRVPHVAQVVGLNFLRGQRVGDQRVDVAGVTVVAPEVPSGATVCVTIPPSAIALYQTRPQGSPHNTWPVTVSDILPVGQTARVSLASPFALVAEVTTAAAELRLESARSCGQP